MSLVLPIARNLDTPPRIMGISPMELAFCVLAYAFLITLLQGLPFATLIALGLSLLMGGSILILNRSYPPYHGIYFLLHLLRPQVTPVMAFSTEGGLR